MKSFNQFVKSRDKEFYREYEEKPSPLNNMPWKKSDSDKPAAYELPKDELGRYVHDGKRPAVGYDPNTNQTLYLTQQEFEHNEKIEKTIPYDPSKEHPMRKSHPHLFKQPVK